MNKNYWWIAIFIVLAVGLVLILRPAPAPTAPAVPAATNESPAVPPAGNVPVSPSVKAPAGGTTGKAIAITITSPAGGDKWEIGKIHTIKWSRAAGVSGAIELIDFKTGNIAGWVLSQTGPDQTSYDWDTNQLFVSRNSALGKQLSGGSYAVRLAFDNRNFSPAQSAPFSVAYSGQIQAAAYNVTIQSYAFSPRTLTVKQGDKVIFTNYDSVAHTIAFQSMTPISLAPGASYTLETGSFSPAPYSYYCSIHPSMTATLIVQ